jgi:hypothetical protein
MNAQRNARDDASRSGGTGTASRALRGAALVALVAAIAGCGDGGPSAPPGGSAQFLAGGGRSASDDPFAGGRDDSGPGHPEGRPDFDPPSGLISIFFSEKSCFAEPLERVITTREEWEAWWTEAVSCLPRWVPPIDPPPHDPDDSTRWGNPDSTWDDVDSSGHDPGDGWDDDDDDYDDDRDGESDGGWVAGDSGVVDPSDPWNPYGPDAPEVDFARNVVVAISVEADSGWGRGVYVKEVADDAGRSLVRYEVSRLGDDCAQILMIPISPDLVTSPTIAVIVPRPIAEPVAFERTDVTWNCTWEPHPSVPLTLYYTDAECDLGPDEQIIADAVAWRAWTDAAVACDVARWGDPTDPDKPIGADGSTDPGEPGDPGIPVPPPTRWTGIDVDFTTHAVIVLRAGSQSRWGGGVWLGALDATAGASTIEYTVMEPSESCPEIGGGKTLRPTVAIRVPLPLASTAFARRVERIDCDWGGVGGREPRPPVDDEDDDGDDPSGERPDADDADPLDDSDWSPPPTDRGP